MAHKSQLAAVIIDCKTDNLDAATAFWSAALGYAPLPTPPMSGYTKLDMPDHQPKVLLQSVSHDPRVHLDIETDNRTAERDRLVNLGATVVTEMDDDAEDKHWTVLEAPTGHRFCLVGPGRANFEDKANVWGPA